MNYESTVTWRQLTDRLRCTPSMNGHPRYNCVIVNLSESNTIFCRLIRLFVYHSQYEKHALALVQPLDAPCTLRPGDRKLGLCKVREKPRCDSIVIPAHSIVWGSLLAKDHTNAGKFLVVDTLDTDMFLHLIELFPDRDMVTIG